MVFRNGGSSNDPSETERDLETQKTQSNLHLVRQSLESDEMCCLSQFENAQRSIEETWRLQQQHKERVEQYQQEQDLSLEQKVVILCEEQLGFHLKGPNLHAMRQRLHFFLCTLGIRPSQLESILKRSPRLLLASTKRFLSPLSRFYKYHGMSNLELGEIVVRCPEFMLVPIENDMELKIEHLKSIGIPTSTVFDLIRCQPSAFTVEFEFDFRRKIDFLLEKGIPPETVLYLLKQNEELLKHPIDLDTIQNQVRFLRVDSCEQS